MLEGGITTPQRNQMLNQVFESHLTSFLQRLLKKTHDFSARSLPAAAADDLLGYSENKRKPSLGDHDGSHHGAWGFPLSRKPFWEAISMALFLLMDIYTNSPPHRNIFCCLFNNKITLLSPALSVKT